MIMLLLPEQIRPKDKPLADVGRYCRCSKKRSQVIWGTGVDDAERGEIRGQVDLVDQNLVVLSDLDGEGNAILCTRSRGWFHARQRLSMKVRRCRMMRQGDDFCLDSYATFRHPL